MKILFVDDEKEILTSIRRQLRKEQFSIEMCSSGKSAMELLQKQDIGIVVSDERMPEISGLDLMKKIKKLYPNTIRIILSGFADSQTIIDAINQGEIFRFISKPWSYEDLIKSLNEAIKKWEINQHNKRYMEKIIEENKRLKRRLSFRESSLDLSREVLDSIPSPVIAINDDNKIADFNEKASNILSGDISIGDKITKIIPEEIYVPLEENFRDSNGSEETHINLENRDYSIYIRGLRPTDIYKGIIILESTETANETNPFHR